jgi:hypothetical protein
MTTKFRIDKPGVYKMRNGRRIYVWPLLLSRDWWSCEDGNGSASAPREVYRSNGRLLISRESEYDIVEYVCPLPAEFLHRMVEALDAAEYQPQQAAPATFGEVLKAMAEECPK